MAELNLEIITPSSKAFSGNINSITLPGTAGSFQVLYNHSPILSTIEIGIIKVELTDKETAYYATGGGTVEVLDNKVLVLADSIEKVENIDLDRAKSALERAQDRIAKKNVEEIDVARANAALLRAQNRIKAYDKYMNG